MTHRDLLDRLARDARTAAGINLRLADQARGRADPETATAHDLIAAKHAARAEALERALAVTDAAERCAAYIGDDDVPPAVRSLVAAVRDWRGAR